MDEGTKEDLEFPSYPTPKKYHSCPSSTSKTIPHRSLRGKKKVHGRKLKTTWFWAIPLYDKAPSIFLFLALHSPKRQRRSTWLPIIKSGYPSRNTSASPLAVHQFFTGSCKWDLRARWKGRANRQLQNLFRKKQATKSALFLGGWREVVGSDVCERCGVQGEALPGYDVLTPFGHP